MEQSAGILLYRRNNDIEFLLAHPGGPFWAKKDTGAWTIPKGLIEKGEDSLQAARREFFEETGKNADGPYITLTPLKQKSGKLVHAFALEGNLDVTELKSNLFEMTWPPRSGKLASFPEIDKVQWFNTGEALLKILPGQLGFIKELTTLLSSG